MHRLNLVSFVSEHLQQAIVSAGSESQFRDEWLSRVDKDVLKAFGELGIV